MQIAGTILGAGAQAISGISQHKAGMYNYEVARQNQQIAIQQAALEESRNRSQSRFNQGRARAQFGASGSNMTGSGLDILNDNVLNNELDAAIIRMQGALHARQWGMEASQQKSAAKGALYGTPLSIAGTLLNGFGGMGGGGSAGASPLKGNWGGPR